MINNKLIIKNFGNDLSENTEIVSEELPELKSDQVLIKNAYAGINAIFDRELYLGRVPYIKNTTPFSIGVESIGEIYDAHPNVKSLKKGDFVSVVKIGSAYQEFQIRDESEVIQIPKIDPKYLALNPTGISAYLALERTAELIEGETIVISAAAGGLGHIMAQLAKRKKCHVVGVCGTEQKKEMLLSLNVCDRIINYKKESVAEVINNEYENKLDVAIDSVGKEIYDCFLENLAPKGRLVVVGIASEFSQKSFEELVQPRSYEKIYWKGASIRAFMNHLFADEHRSVFKEIVNFYEQDSLQIFIDPTLFSGIESVVDASNYLLSGNSCGKVVVKI